MFSGIVESTGKIINIVQNGTNKHFTIQSEISKEAYIDQSIAHNGVCLTVVNINDDTHTVTAIEETLLKSNLGSLQINDLINLERSVMATSRMDGHFVQGHVDTTTTCIAVEEAHGSWYFTFDLAKEFNKLVVSKGSVCINGVSLTIAAFHEDHFKVAIIPYTYEHTNFRRLKKGDSVNIEFDILGKYIVNYLDKLQISQ